MRVDGPRDRDYLAAEVGLRVEDPHEAGVRAPLADVRPEAEVAPRADEQVRAVGELRLARHREADGNARQACDLLARTAFTPIELPVGIVTALVGAPFFLWLLMRRIR